MECLGLGHKSILFQ